MAAKKNRKQGSQGKRASKRKFPLWTLGVLVLVVVGIVAFQSGWFSGSGSEGGGQGAAIGTKAPAFQLSDLSGKRYALADYNGKKPVLVEFIWTG
ncbi:MAG TPA: hypothetical protein VJM80_05795 [bacterium]|nr:hypothetical protein [bacterium]